MQMGQTVYYRLSKQDAENVNKRREYSRDFHNQLKQLGMYEDHVSQRLLAFTVSGYVCHMGTPVLEGELLPAHVVVCYSAQDLGHDQYGEPYDKPDAYQQFSGVADIRVLLPGSDVLYVPRAKEDMIPTAAEGRHGHGITALPAPGKFVQSVPAPLLG